MSRLPRFSFLAASILGALLVGSLSIQAQASTWFVATNGNDGNSCSASSSPCQSVNGAYQKAAGGDTIQVAGGNYGGQNLGAKSPASDIIVQPASGASVTFSDLNINGATHLEFRNITSGGLMVNMNSNFVTFRNMTFTDAIFYLGGSNISMIGGSVGPSTNNHSQIAPANGWQGQGVNFLFDGVLFHDFKRTDSSVHIECLQVAGTTNMVIRNTKFRTCDVFDLSFTQYNDSGLVTNLLMENNVFDTATNINGTGNGSGAVHWTAVSGVTARFNSSKAYWWAGREHGPISGIVLTGNDVSGGILDGDGGGCLPSSDATYNYNVTQGWKCGGTDVNAAPGFVNAGALDLSLQAGSPAIDFVPTTMQAPTKDIAGNSRPQGSKNDAGAFEFGSGGATAQAPLPPTNLTAILH